jgi:hypothetical protein
MIYFIEILYYLFMTLCSDELDNIFLKIHFIKITQNLVFKAVLKIFLNITYFLIFYDQHIAFFTEFK